MQQLEQILQQAAGRVSPGGVMLAGQGDDLPLIRAFGHLGEPTGPLSTADTVYDVASVTKAVVTAALLKLAVAGGRCSLSDPIGNWFPGFSEGRRALITVRHLLGHASGLVDWKPFYTRAERMPVLQQVSLEPLVCAPGTAQIYSDLGYILLGALLEKLYAKPLDQLAAERLFDPLQLTRTGFRRIAGSTPDSADLLARSIAPTEFCSWRGRRAHGEVHDENAAAMGGVAGHAGLFSCVSDLHRISRELLAAFLGRSSLFDRDVVSLFWQRDSSPAPGTRRLGWDSITPGPDCSSAGHYLSLETVGHLGFTGCSLWIDPTTEITVVLLTNRVYYGRENQLIKSFRRQTHDAVARIVGYEHRRADSSEGNSGPDE